MPVRRKTQKTPTFPSNWDISETYQVSPTVTLTKGDECKVKNERGKFRFIKHITMTNDDGSTVEWVTIYGGTFGQEQWRSVYPDRLNVPNTKAPSRPKKKRNT